MIDDARHRILAAAARVYAQHGWRGATTRRIAEEAGVNEVTLFRQFGSKDALLATAMRECARHDATVTLPSTPQDPARELLTWATAQHAWLSDTQVMIRQMLSEAYEHPDTALCAAEGPSSAFVQLQQYVVQLRRHGWMDGTAAATPADVHGAVTMLMGALFADAMHRDLMPSMFPQAVDVSLPAYVGIFLRGIGVASEPSSPASRTVPRPSRSSPSPSA